MDAPLAAPSASSVDVPRRLLIAASALLGGLLGWHAPDEGDLFWHMSLGRAVLRAGARTVPEPYALGALGEPRVVPEWLWGVFTYQIEQLGGFAALTVLTVLLGATAGVLCAAWLDRLCREQTPEAPAGLVLQGMLTLLALTLLATRLRLRPELPALCLTLGFVLLARDFASLPQSQRWKRGAALLGISLIWAQLHGSFILAPALFVCSAGTPGPDRAARRDLLALLFGLTLSLLSGAHGAALLQYILDHAGGDGARHMLDMRPPDWSTFDPRSVYGLGLSLCALSWPLGLLLAPARLRDVALAALGLALFLTAVRFAVLLCLFGMPLSVAGLARVARTRASWAGTHTQRVQGGAATALALALLISLVRTVDRAHPLLVSAIPAHTFPLRAAAVLGRLPPGTAVYTPAMEAGSLLGFMGDGRLRVTLDSRVPLHFDDAAYGAHRDSEQTPEALARLLQRFDVEAAVAPRGTTVCRLLAQRMRLASVDPAHATFVRGQGSALPAFDPCSPDHLVLPCPDARARAESLRVVRAQRDDAYAAWLTSISGLACGEPGTHQTALPSTAPRALNSVRDAVVRWRVRALWRAGQQEHAIEELTRELRWDDTRALSVLPELWGGRPTPHLVSLYRQLVRESDDFTPPATRQRLAVLCLAAGDLECAYQEALRSAVLGDPLAPRVLQRVAQHHPSEHVRRNLRAWLRVLAPPQ